MAFTLLKGDFRVAFYLQLGASINGGTTKSSIFNGIVPYKYRPAKGVAPFYGNHLNAAAHGTSTMSSLKNCHHLNQLAVRDLVVAKTSVRSVPAKAVES